MGKYSSKCGQESNPNGYAGLIINGNSSRSYSSTKLRIAKKKKLSAEHQFEDEDDDIEEGSSEEFHNTI